VFANAGTAQLAPLDKITEEHYDAIFNVNVKGLVFTVQKALARMPDGGSIILNASIFGSQGPAAPRPRWGTDTDNDRAFKSVVHVRAKERTAALVAL
jgi:NAD(P)-dependent dehydrogenase (short-subunit alcohol dehydrogenase family)